MEWVQLEHGDVTDDGSQGVHTSEAARLEDVDGFSVHLARVAPGGLLGRHPTRLWQLFAVTSGSGWVAASDGVRHAIQSGQAVMWSLGEEPESGSDEGMSVVITQSTAPLPRGGAGIQRTRRRMRTCSCSASPRRVVLTRWPRPAAALFSPCPSE